MAVSLRDSPITLAKMLAPKDPALRRTKIVCTIGPSCWDVDTLVAMIDAGMNVARLNFSHGDHERHGETVKAIREAASRRPGCNIAIMLDTKGPEIRTGKLKGGGPVTIKRGSTIFITTDYDAEGDETTMACSYKALPESVRPGQKILCADGSLVLRVLELREDGVTAEALNDATIGEKKNMNLPGVVVQLPTITAKDEDDIVNFGIPQRVDMIAASFVRKGSDIRVIREALGEAGAGIKVIAKIESQEGLENFDGPGGVLDEADGIMVARGDLGMELPPEVVFAAQKTMISKCNLAGKPVITATQMLESMVARPRPTRAEASDVANAVLDGTDAVMLSGETAGGSYPLEAVTMMARICVEAEACINYDLLYTTIRAAALDAARGEGRVSGASPGGGEGVEEAAVGALSVPESIASSAVKTAIDLGASTIIVCSDTGNTARLVAKFRPPIPVLVLTATEEVARYTQGLLRGCRAVATGSMLGTDALLVRAVEMCREWEWVKSSDKVVAIHGLLEGRPGSTNLLKVLNVP